LHFAILAVTSIFFKSIVWSKKFVRKIILLWASLFILALSMSASPVMAQNVLWVASFGSDTNACHQTSPCATFQGAINKGGSSTSQINCLDSGSYGPVTITASITIDCGAGNVGNIVSSSATAITINTPAAATIILRHLSMNGLLTTSVVNGIDARGFSSGTLIVEDCMIQGYRSETAINFAPSGGRGLLQVANSQIFNNVDGIVVLPQNGQIASVTLNRVELVGNVVFGLFLSTIDTGIVTGTMRNSVAGENGNTGVVAMSTQVFFTIEESSIVNNLVNGIQTFSAGATVNVGRSTIGGNGTGVFAQSGSIISFGNNQMSVNGTNGSFTSTTPLQ
jgi:hypothetical protein